MAQNHLILINDLHLLYLATPYDISHITPVGSIYYDVVIILLTILYCKYIDIIYFSLLFKIMSLTESQMQVARLLGITEATANQLRNGITPKVSLSH